MPPFFDETLQVCEKATTTEDHIVGLSEFLYWGQYPDGAPINEDEVLADLIGFSSIV